MKFQKFRQRIWIKTYPYFSSILIYLWIWKLITLIFLKPIQMKFFLSSQKTMQVFKKITIFFVHSNFSLLKKFIWINVEKFFLLDFFQQTSRLLSNPPTFIFNIFWRNLNSHLNEFQLYLIFLNESNERCSLDFDRLSRPIIKCDNEVKEIWLS